MGSITSKIIFCQEKTDTPEKMASLQVKIMIMQEILSYGIFTQTQLSKLDCAHWQDKGG